MKVLHLITKSNWGGAQRCVHDLAVDALEAGIDVAVAVGGDGPLVERLREAGVRVISIPSLSRDISARGDISSAVDIWRTVGAEKPDILHLHSSKAGGVGALIGRLRRVPAIVFTAHGWAFNEPRPEWQRAVIRLLHVATVLLSHRTVAVAAAIPRQLGFGSLLRRRYTVIQNGIDFLPLAPRDKAQATVAALSPKADFILSNQGKKVVIGVLAELHKIKGLDVLIEAAAEIRRRYPSVDFGIIVLGQGEERERLEALIESRNLGGHVTLAGFAPNAPTLLSAFDILAMPSRSEALPMALLEAGAAGLPCVASRVGGIPEVIENLETGLLVSPERPRELAEALRRLIDDPNLRDRLGDALQAKVHSRFSRSRMSTATLALYRRMTVRRG